MAIDRELLDQYPYFQKQLKTYPQLIAILDPVADVDSFTFHRVVLRGINNFKMPPAQIIKLHEQHGHHPQAFYDALFAALTTLHMKQIVATYTNDDVLLLETFFDLQREHPHSFRRILDYFRQQAFDHLRFKQLCERYDYSTKRIAASILDPASLKVLQTDPDDATHQLLEVIVKKKEQAQQMLIEQETITRELRQVEQAFDAGSVSQAHVDKRIAVLQPRHEKLKREMNIHAQCTEGLRLFLLAKHGIELKSLVDG